MVSVHELSARRSIVSPPSPLHRPAPRGLLSLQRLAGNRAFGLQAKLTISQPGDPYELEADRVADQVMRMPEPTVQRSCECGGTCDECKEEEESHVHRAPDPGVSAAAVAGAAVPDSVAGVLRAPGEPLDGLTRNYLQPRLGADLSTVRVHRDQGAAASARDVQALAYTVGNHVVFGSGQYAPGTTAGRRLIAHELVHTLQQGATAPPMIARVSAAMCSSDCAGADGGGGPSGQYLLTVHADREGPFLLMPLTSKVGHSWVQLTDDTGSVWTYGFWPKTGFDPAHPASDVDGCVHHPDTAHRPSASRTFTLTAAQFAAAKARAAAICAAPPKYNLFGLQCTEFVRQMLEAAGQAPALGFGLIWESPNALNTWIRGHSLMLGASVPAAASGSGATGFGATTAELSYRYQFYSLLGEKVRLSLLARGELGKYQQSVSTGLGVDLTTNRVFLPRIYLFGGGIAGGLPSALPGATGSKAGAGVTTGGGLAFDIDQLATVGIEYNLVKDIVSNDPEVHRLMITAKIPLF
jgi:hypothetical protein